MTLENLISDVTSATATPDNSMPEAHQNQLLEFAWERQKTYSQNASFCQSRFVFLRTLIVLLSLFVIILSVLQPQIKHLFSTTESITESMDSVVSGLLLISPVTITALLAFSVKFDRGNNWLMLRGSAEALKMEIYCYRSRIRNYRWNRDETLARKIKVISERLKGSAVHQAALKPYEMENRPNYKLGLILKMLACLSQRLGHLFHWVWVQLFEIQKQSDKHELDEDKFSDLDAETYLRYRLAHQFIWYRNKAQILDKQLQWLEAGIYIFGGLGTLLAASDNYKSWVAVTTALTGAFSNYLDFKRLEATLVGYNQAADALYDVHTWWAALPPTQKQKPENFERLVINAEEIIRSEHASWLQDMQDRLAEMYGVADTEVAPATREIEEKPNAEAAQIREQLALSPHQPKHLSSSEPP